jgi:hypothetical protein
MRIAISLDAQFDRYRTRADHQCTGVSALRLGSYDTRRGTAIWIGRTLKVRKITDQTIVGKSVAGRYAGPPADLKWQAGAANQSFGARASIRAT